jgi:adenine-specific DNA-methyltransferase
MKDVYYNPSIINQNLLSSTIDNVKEDRTSLDLLFQVMLDLGIELSAKIEEKEVNGKKFYLVNENYLSACFDLNIDEKTIREIAKYKPVYAVFRDASFESDSSNINCEQIIKSISISTELRVL